MIIQSFTENSIAETLERLYSTIQAFGIPRIDKRTDRNVKVLESVVINIENPERKLPSITLRDKVKSQHMDHSDVVYYFNNFFMEDEELEDKKYPDTKSYPKDFLCVDVIDGLHQLDIVMDVFEEFPEDLYSTYNMTSPKDCTVKFPNPLKLLHVNKDENEKLNFTMMCVGHNLLFDFVMDTMCVALMGRFMCQAKPYKMGRIQYFGNNLFVEEKSLGQTVKIVDVPE